MMGYYETVYYNENHVRHWKGEDGNFYDEDGRLNTWNEEFFIHNYSDWGGNSVPVDNPVYDSSTTDPSMVEPDDFDETGAGDGYNDRTPPSQSQDAGADYIPRGDLGDGGVLYNPADLVRWADNVEQISEQWLPTLRAAAEACSGSAINAGLFSQGYQVNDIVKTQIGPHYENSASDLDTAYRSLIGGMREVAATYTKLNEENDVLLEALTQRFAQVDDYLGGAELGVDEIL